MSARVIGAVVAIAVLGLGVAAWIRNGRGLDASAPIRPPNIILITIDTLRPDHLSAYGHTVATSPTIDALARGGVTFTHAYSTSSWTAPAIASLLTSTLPLRHGVVHGVIRAGELYGQETVPPDLPNIPEMLRARGYRTLGVAANVHLEGEFGFARGFDRYSCPGFVSAEHVVDIVRTWTPDVTSQQPFFAWVHFLDPHEPYEPREPWLTEFLAGRPHHPELDSQPAGSFAQIGLSGERLDYVKTLYDSEIRHTDERLAEVLRLLRVTDDDLVIFTSDHGEEFGEHGLFQHGRSLNEASVRIPLIVRYPRRELAGQTSAAPVSIMDVFPTILQVVGSPAPSGLDGTTLSAAQRVDPENPTPILLELFRRDQHLRALVLAPWKLIVDLKRPAQPRLFDLRQEPTEDADLAPSSTETVVRLQNVLTDYLAAQKSRPAAQTQQALTPKQIDQLRAMGYLQ